MFCWICLCWSVQLYSYYFLSLSCLELLFLGDVSRDTSPIVRQGVWVYMWYLRVRRGSKYCKDCEAVMWEKQSEHRNIRAEEHITTIKSGSKRNHTAEHCWKYNHDFAWEHKKVLDFKKSWKTELSRRQSTQKKTSINYINGKSFKVHIPLLTKFRPENPCGVKRSHAKNFWNRT